MLLRRILREMMKLSVDVQREKRLVPIRWVIMMIMMLVISLLGLNIMTTMIVKGTDYTRIVLFFVSCLLFI